VGYERLTGELAGGMPAWEAAGQPVRRIELVPAARAGEDGEDVLDVRQADEFAMGHVPGARHIELGSVSRAGLDQNGRPLTVMCQSGPRAMSAASILAADGHRGLRVALGGAQDWAVARRRPLQTGS
jgi:hydroxyacylglutathione hydrolase